MADHHTRDRFIWLDQVLADRDIPDSAFRLAYAITSFINRGARYAWPSHATLAKQIGFDDRSIRRCVAILQQAGHLDVESGGGRHKTNRYRPILLPSESRTQESVFNEETRTH